MLIDNFKERCVLLEKVQTPDGEGGSLVKWQKGQTFEAAIITKGCNQTLSADQNNIENLYEVTLPIALNLKAFDVFQRLSDGQIFIVTSDADDIETPSCASFQFRQIGAKEWQLP